MATETTNEKKHYLLKLLPPRQSFPFDMTDEERNIMKQHVEYWTDLMNKGVVVVFGPAMDTKNPYGIGIIEVEDEKLIQPMIDNDPAVKSGVGHTEIYPMKAIIRK